MLILSQGEFWNLSDPIDRAILWKDIKRDEHLAQAEKEGLHTFQQLLKAHGLTYEKFKQLSSWLFFTLWFNN